MVSIFVVDCQDMARFVIELLSAPGTDETMDFKRPLTVVALPGGGLL